MADLDTGPMPASLWTASAARLRTANVYLVDGAVAATVAVAVLVTIIARADDTTLLGVLLNAGTVIPLVWRRRAPFAISLVVAAFAILVSAYNHPGEDLQYGGLVAIYTVADLGRRWQRWGFFWGILITIPPSALFVKNNDAEEFMFTLLLPLTAYLLGTLARTSRARTEALRDRADQLTREREAVEARAAVEERARIARDMHDVLAHAVSIMVVQAEAGPVVVHTDPDRAGRAFDAIAEAGHDAMLQLRRLLGVLKDDHDVDLRAPQPTVAAIPRLIETASRANLRVDLQVVGAPAPLSADTEAAAYRILQEALTNTVKHANADTVTVRLHWHEGLTITVTDNGRGARRAERTGGHGLIGIHERAVACGGHSETAPVPGGGFRVVACLPSVESGPIRSIEQQSAAAEKES